MVSEVCLGDALFEGAKEVFETMVFMNIEKSVEPEPRIADATLFGSITFKGSIDGCLGLCCSLSCARTIAGNMLGLDAAGKLSEDDITDAVGEVVNMVMGSVKSRIQADVGNIEVSIPSVVTGRYLTNSLGDGATRVTAKVSIEEECDAELSLLYRDNSR